MAGISAIQGVDDTLKTVVDGAVDDLLPKPLVTVGPLDRDHDGLRLNWFLYRIVPNAAFRNMEPPQTGWRTARGNPPLALTLQYLLSAFPAAPTDAGDQDQFAHIALAAAMQALHANAIIGDGHPALALSAGPLVEPLRISLESLDLESLSKLWTATTDPLRLSVGYQVGLVTVDSLDEHVAGPPVRTRRLAVVPSMGPHITSVDPQRASFGDELLVAVNGLSTGATFSLARDPRDPPGPAGGWPMLEISAPPAPPGHVRLGLPRGDLAPGPRRLDVTVVDSGLPFGSDSIGLTVVPLVTGPAGPLAKGVPLALDTAHGAPDVEVFLDGARLDVAAAPAPTATELTVTIGPATPAGPATIALRAGKVAGPDVTVEVAP